MTGPGSNATADARKDRIHESIVELSAPTHAKYPRENTETMVKRFPRVTATRRRDHSPRPLKKRDSSNTLKKKPEIVRSRAKSTKGGGWRRQPWHVGSVSLAALSGFGTAPTAFQHPMRCIVSVFFVRCKNFFRAVALSDVALHFCRNVPPSSPESRTRQCVAKMEGYCRTG